MLLHLLQGAFVFATLAGLAAGLSAWAGRTRRPWALARAVLLGDRADAEAPATGRPARDVRFAAFAASLAAAIVAALALRDGLRGLGVVRLTLGLATIAPLLAVAIAGLADAGRRARRRVRALRRARAAPAEVVTQTAPVVSLPGPAPVAAASTDAPPTADAPDAALAQCTDTVRAARHEVERARLAQPDEGVRAALDALDEALDEYAQALAGPERRARLDGVAALAQACHEPQAPAPSPLELVVNARATPAEVWSLVDALAAVYRTHPAAHASHAATLEAAARRLVGERPPESLVAPAAGVALRLAA